MIDYLILESKNYPLYKGVDTETMLLILKDNNIINNGYFNSPIRDKTTTKTVISVTRNKNYAVEMGDFIIVFDTVKLSSKFKIIPFSENPDFYLELQDKYNLRFKTKEDLKNILRFKEYNDIYWKVKTDRSHDDFDIAEELIVADKIDISKYVKKILYTNWKKDFDFYNKNNITINKSEKDLVKIKTKLDELGIDNNIVIKQ